MRIMISGSMAFAREMLATKKKLEEMGHSVGLPYETEIHVERPDFVDDLSNNLQYCIENDVMRKGFDEIVNADAVLVLNHPRKGIDGYIGTSTLMEIALAYYSHKKIFLLNPVPDFDTVRWAHEIAIMQPTIINGDLSKIS